MKTYNKHAQTKFLFGWEAAVSISSFLLIMVLSSPASHASGAVKIEFEAQEVLAPLGPPGKIWVSDGVQHIRDFALAGPVWGDLNGTLTVVANINLDLTTGDGTAYGTFILEVEWNGLIGTFEGRSQWKYDGFLISTGQGSGHGTGDFEGMQFHGNFFSEDGRTPLVGTILIPHGD